MISLESLKKILSKFCTGVTVITVNINENYHGLTVSSFASVSLKPPLVLFCRENKDSGYKFLSRGDPFVVNILSERQGECALCFADPKVTSAKRFENRGFKLSVRDVPILNNIIGYLECETCDILSKGDHNIYIGEVKEIGHFEGKNPLIYFGSAFHSLQKSDFSILT